MAKKTITEIMQGFERGEFRLFIPRNTSDKELEEVAVWFDAYAEHEPYTGGNFLRYFMSIRAASPNGEYAFLNFETRGVYDGATEGYFLADRARKDIHPISIDKFLYVAHRTELEVADSFNQVWG